MSAGVYTLVWLCFLHSESICLVVFVAQRIYLSSCVCCTANLSDEQKRWFIDYYKKLCRLGVKDADRPSHRDHDAEPAGNKAPVSVAEHVAKEGVM